MHFEQKRRYPFDSKKPIGYLVAWLTQFATAACTAMAFIQFVNFIVGSCWLFTFVAKDITQRDLTAFNTAATKATKSSENRTKLTNRFCDMLQIYSDTKQ